MKNPNTNTVYYSDISAVAYATRIEAGHAYANYLDDTAFQITNGYRDGDKRPAVSFLDFINGKK